MKKTFGLMVLLASSAAMLVSPAMARDRDDSYRGTAPNYQRYYDSSERNYYSSYDRRDPSGDRDWNRRNRESREHLRDSHENESRYRR